MNDQYSQNWYWPIPNIQCNMKTILLHPQAIQAFNHESRQNISQNGQQLQTLGYLLGYEQNSHIRTSELIFPFQDGSLNPVEEIGNDFFSMASLQSLYYHLVF